MTQANMSAERVSRTSLRAVKFLLPVWGERFVAQWLDYSLPCLLAPHNIPAITAKLPCEFEILTTTDLEASIRQHPGFARLSRLLPCKITAIDHLITSRNHSTAITLAFEESVRATGQQMLDTLFFFMVSDFIFSNGSFSAVLDRVQSGADAVMVGNLQVAAEQVTPLLNNLIEPDTGVMKFSSRELMRLCIDNLHPAISANIVNNVDAHNIHTNRLFWKVDENTLLGRVYLKHMLAIRPETTDFKIGASCDYSFVPEMCPSGRVADIADSDECFAVEVQPIGHESDFLRPGKMPLQELGATLSEWTTAHHRKNAETTLLFHAGVLPESLPNYIAEVDRYMSELNEFLSPQPKPHRGHPYWKGAIAASRETRGLPLSKEEEYWLRELTTPESHRIEDIRNIIFGKAPFVHRWDPHWQDYSPIFADLRNRISDNTSTFVCLSNAPSAWTVMLSKLEKRYKRIEANLFLQKPASWFEHLKKSIDTCMLELTPPDIPEINDYLVRLSPLMKPNGKVLLVLSSTSDFNPVRAVDAFACSTSSLSLAEINIVPMSPFRKRLIDAFNRHAHYCRSKRNLGPLPFLFKAVPIAFLSFANNMLHSANNNNNNNNSNKLPVKTTQKTTSNAVVPPVEVRTIYAIFHVVENQESQPAEPAKISMVKC